MLKGQVFSKQLFENQIFALFINTFLNGQNGVSDNYKNGMAVTYSGSNITIASGAVCIQGRFLEEDTSTTLSAGTDNAYCKLVVEIDLDKQNTESDFEQGYYKIVKGANSYPALTQSNIVKNNAGVYQYELARFKTSASGITEFQDMRTFLDFNSIYDEIQQHIQDIDDGSLWVQKEGDTMTGPLKFENKDNYFSIIKTRTMKNKDYEIMVGLGLTDGDTRAEATLELKTEEDGILGKLGVKENGDIVNEKRGKKLLEEGDVVNVAKKLETARNIKLTGAVTGNANFDGSGNVTIVTTNPNIAVVTGTITLTDGTGSTTVNYPTGFTKDNSVVLSIGMDIMGNNNSVISYNTGSLHLYEARCSSSNISVRCVPAGQAMGSSVTKNFRLVLMKIA